MKEVIKELVVKFTADSKQLTKDYSNVGNTTQKLMSTIKGALSFTALVAGVKSLTNAFQKQAIAYADYNALTGIAVEDTAMLAGALERLGGNAESTMSQMSNLQSMIHDARFGQGALVDATKRYGIEIFNQNGELKNASELLRSLSEDFQGLTAVQRQDIGGMLGFDSSMVALLSQGQSGLENALAIQKNIGVMTGKDAKLAKEWRDSIVSVKQQLNAIVLPLQRKLIPLATKATEQFEKWIDYAKKHKMVFVGAISALVVAFAPLIASATLFATKVLIALSPFILLGALIVGVGLAFEDLLVYFKGGDSVTGQLVKKFPKLEKSLEAIRPYVLEIAGGFKDIKDYVANLTFEKLVEDLKKLPKKIGETVGKVWASLFDFGGWIAEKISDDDNQKALIEGFKRLFAGVKNMVTSIFTDFFSGIGEGIADTALGKQIDKIGSFFGLGDDESQSVTNTVKPTPLSYPVFNAGNSTSNSFYTSLNMKNNVSTNNPQTFGTQALDFISQGFKNAVTQTSTGVL